MLCFVRQPVSVDRFAVRRNGDFLFVGSITIIVPSVLLVESDISPTMFSSVSSIRKSMLFLMLPEMVIVIGASIKNLLDMSRRFTNTCPANPNGKPSGKAVDSSDVCFKENDS